MAVAGRSGEAPAASDAAHRLREAAFVRLLARPTGDALAATGLLARALDATETPFQARIAPTGAPDRLADDETTVIVGATTPAADIGFPSGPTPASDAAFGTARAVDGAHAPDPVLALAGAFAADRGPLPETAGSALDAARERDLVERRPGVATPVSDLADGVAHTTLVHGPFSGDPDAARTAVGDLGPESSTPDTEDHRRAASWLALGVAGGEDATPRGAEAVERALQPHVLADPTPFATVGGYADVLGAVACEDPGTGLALVLGHDTADAALSAWREHGRRAHSTVREATFERDREDGATDEDDLAIARVEGSAPLATTARLLCDFRAPVPAAVAVTDGRAAAAAIDDSVPHERMTRAASALDGTANGGDRRAVAQFDATAEAFVAALREER